MLALVEARQAAIGMTEWCLGFVHLTNAPVSAQLDGLDIFEASHWTPTKSAGRHHLGIAVERHPASLSK